MYAADIKEQAKTNSNFRKVLHTGEHSQLVAMSLLPDEDIGMETHQETDQILFFVDGQGEVIVNNDHRQVEEHDVVFVPAGAEHNVINTGEKALKLFTVYAPASHPDGTVHATKAAALIDESAENATETPGSIFAESTVDLPHRDFSTTNYYGSWMPLPHRP